jgi:plastocyanin
MRGALVAAAAVAAALAAAAPAHAQATPQFVFAQNQAFSPKALNVLTGETVVWRNTSQKTHNVKFDNGDYNSGRFGPGEVRNNAFPTDGVYAYHCTIHTGMTGQIGVYPLVLEGPAGRIRRGRTIAFGVRAPDGASAVVIQADYGAGWVTVAGTSTAAPGPGHQGHDAPGELHADAVASESATYRASFSGGTSNELRVEVSDAPDVFAAAKRERRADLVTVRTNPAAPKARVVLQLKLRERFGWYPVARARLDKRSRASFVVHGHRGVPARVVLVGPDWATPLSQSRTVRLPRRR